MDRKRRIVVGPALVAALTIVASVGGCTGHRAKPPVPTEGYGAGERSPAAVAGACRAVSRSSLGLLQLRGIRPKLDQRTGCAWSNESRRGDPVRELAVTVEALGEDADTPGAGSEEAAEEFKRVDGFDINEAAFVGASADEQPSVGSAEPVTLPGLGQEAKLGLQWAPNLPYVGAAVVVRNHNVIVNTSLVVRSDSLDRAGGVPTPSALEQELWAATHDVLARVGISAPAAAPSKSYGTGEIRQLADDCSGLRAGSGLIKGLRPRPIRSADLHAELDCVWRPTSGPGRDYLPRAKQLVVRVVCLTPDGLAGRSATSAAGQLFGATTEGQQDIQVPGAAAATISISDPVISQTHASLIARRDNLVVYVGYQDPDNPTSPAVESAMTNLAAQALAEAS